MKPTYDDIIDVMGPPVWYDHRGVPRYKPFMPDMINIYSTMGVLSLHGCQSCPFTWLAGGAWEPWNWRVRRVDGKPEKNDLADIVHHMGYGDAPRHGGCAGETMSTATLKIVRVFQRDTRPGGAWADRWERVPSLEAFDPLEDDHWAAEALEETPDRWIMDIADSYQD